MDEGQSQEQLKPVERRRGADRRRMPRDPGPSENRIQVLLARLVSVFIGGLLGFLVAHIISAGFIEQWTAAGDEASRIIRDFQRDLTDLEPAYTKARQQANFYEEHQELVVPDGTVGQAPEPDPASEVAGLAIQPEAGESVEPAPEEAADGAETAAPVAAGDVPPAAGVGEEELDPSSTRIITEAEFQEIKQAQITLKDRRDSIQNDIRTWENELNDIQQKIDLLNGLGIIIVVVFVFIGYLFYPLTLLVIRRMAGQIEMLSSGLEQRAPQATLGFFAGLVVAVVVLLAVFNMFAGDSTILNYPWFRLLFGAFVVIVTGISGSLIGVSYFGPAREDDPYKEFRRRSEPKVLDTSVVIDGRVHEIATTGFLGGLLIATNSVLRELQTMADSSNERKRSKGRRGLELLRKMQDDPRIEVKVFDDTSFDTQAQSTDEQLILVAQAMGGWVVTNDYNLNRVAAIRNVRVININALANAVKTTHLPGDEIDIAIIDRGKQRGQGVGYLDDGTMVVVEDGEPFIGKTKSLKITSVSQTVQGRLLFGRVDLVQD